MIMSVVNANFTVRLMHMHLLLLGCGCHSLQICCTNWPRCLPVKAVKMLKEALLLTVSPS